MKVTVTRHIERYVGDPTRPVECWSIELKDGEEYFVATAYSEETAKRFARLLRQSAKKVKQ